MSTEERIRRAEEVYQNRRRNQIEGIRMSSRTVNSRTKVDYFLVKKMLLQILICLLVYIIFYLISHTEYFFSQEVLEKTKQILSQDLNWEQIYQSGIRIHRNGKTMARKDNAARNKTRKYDV